MEEGRREADGTERGTDREGNNTPPSARATRTNERTDKTYVRTREAGTSFSFSLFLAFFFLALVRLVYLLDEDEIGKKKNGERDERGRWKRD